MRTFDEYRILVEKRLPAMVPAVLYHARTIHDSMLYSLTAGGKRLRPVMMLAACELAGGDIQVAMPYACAIEFIHTYSLVHDDLPAMDDDELRRGKPTNHMIYGAGMATLAGDGLLNSAFEVMINDISGCPADMMKSRILAAKTIVEGSGVNGMIAGQVADIEAENAGETASEELLEFIHLNKTAALIKASIKAGLYLGGAGPELHEAMDEYSSQLGLAFQIADDILDVTGTTEEIGKPVGSDEAANKLTFVSVYGLDEARKKLHEHSQLAIKALDEIDGDTEFFRKLAEKLEKRSK